jgi:hypothetical protein
MSKSAEHGVGDREGARDQGGRTGHQDLPAMDWLIVPRRWFESRRRAQRRFQERFMEKHTVTQLPDGTWVATVRGIGVGNE